ncbi:MAG: hypothetical protein AAF126_13470, partial [Chloroflexota bacterium]
WMRTDSGGTSHSVLRLEGFSSWLVNRRGLPIILGPVLFFIGGTLEFVNVILENQVIEFVEVFTRNTGIIIALIGILLLEPLGT